MKKLVLIVLLSVLGLSASDDFKMNYDKKTKGLIRKMLVYKAPSWVGKVVTKESKTFYFSSPKSLIEFYYNPEKWPDANCPSQADIKALIITDYSTLNPIDATQAYYVYGTNKTSPAGDDLPAFKHYTQAKEFANKYNGKRILEFKEVKKGLIQLLNGDI